MSALTWGFLALQALLLIAMALELALAWHIERIEAKKAEREE